MANAKKELEAYENKKERKDEIDWLKKRANKLGMKLVTVVKSRK